MLILRIKQAEYAMTKGRLDEAFDLVGDSALRSHQRGQKLIDRLARKFADRANAHLKADNPRAAMADCVRAIELAGAQPNYTALRSRAQIALEHSRAVRHEEQVALDEARRQIDYGRLSIAEDMLQRYRGESHDAIRVQIETRRKLAGPLIDRVRAALKRDDLADAIEALAEARRWHASNEQVESLITQTLSASACHIRKLVEQGNLGLASEFLEHAGRLDRRIMELVELQDVLDQCHKAAANLRGGRVRYCEAHLARLAGMVPKAAWIKTGLQQASSAAKNLDDLHSSPIGHLCAEMKDNGKRKGHCTMAAEPGTTRRATFVENHIGKSTAQTLPQRFILTVSGAGSYLIYRDAAVRIGPISCGDRPDLTLVTDPTTSVVTVERTDGQYLLRSAKPLQLHDKPVYDHLLTSGEVLCLSTRCRLTFMRPNPASGTAILKFSGAKFPRADVRGALLMDREILIGPASSSHVAVTELPQQVAMLVHDGQLIVRGGDGPCVDGKPWDPARGLPFDRSIEIGPLTITLAHQ